jgi:peptidoglycan/LPS O-acetylase OafA/YrhL
MNAKPRLLEIDALRGIAAFSVCLFHFSWFPYGVTGVDLFFMVSGFVIYMSIVNGNTLKRFWGSRVIRIYPVYWLSLVITALFCSACFAEFKPFKINDVLGNLLAMQLLFRAKLFAIVYWTLYIEMVFYILISVIWKLNLLKKIELVISVLFAVIGCIISMYIFIGAESPAYQRFFIVLRGLAPLISYFHLFAAGIIFYQIYYHGVTGLRVFLLVVSFLFILLNNYNTTGVLDLFDKHLLASVVYYGLFVLIINHKARFFRSSIAAFFGNISYALYLVHATFGLWLTQQLWPLIAGPAATAAGIVSAVLSSYFITRYFDLPLRAYLKKRLNGGATGSAGH